MNDHHPHGTGSDNEKMHPVAKALFGWVGLKRTPDIMFYGLLIGALVLIASDFFHKRKIENDLEGVTGFYGIYGFVAFTLVVLAGIPLGKLLRRDENYYGDAEDDGEEGA